MEDGFEEATTKIVPVCKRRFQPIAEHHQLIHLGDNPMLFCKRREAKRKSSDEFDRSSGKCGKAKKPS